MNFPGPNIEERLNVNDFILAVPLKTTSEVILYLHHLFVESETSESLVDNPICAGLGQFANLAKELWLLQVVPVHFVRAMYFDPRLSFQTALKVFKFSWFIIAPNGTGVGVLVGVAVGVGAATSNVTKSLFEHDTNPAQVS